MKEQWSISENNVQLADMEEGLCQEKQKCIKRIEYETNCCTGCIPYLRLIFLLEVVLFFGWGCYMMLQNYRPGEIKTETANIILERYPSMTESLSEIQESRPNTEMPSIFVKPEVIIDKINNLLEDMKFAKDQDLMQNKAIVTNVPSMMQTNMQNSNNVKSNIVGISDINRLFSTLSSGNSDKKFTKSPEEPQIFFSVEYIDENVNTDKNDKFARPSQFLEKLRNISKLKATNGLEKLESKNAFTEDVNRLTLEGQKDHVLDASNKLDNLEFNIVAISNPENYIDHTISVDLINTLQDPKQEFSDLIKDATEDDHNENYSSLLDETDKQVNARAEELGIVICPPYESHEFSDMLIKDSVINNPTFQPLAQEISEQIENGSSDDIAERIEDKHDINDSDMSISASAFGDQDHFDISAVTGQTPEDQYSESIAESIAQIIEDEKYESTENTKNPYKLWFFQPTRKIVESSTPNVDKFQWFNGPPSFVDLGLGDISKSSEIPSSSLWDTNENMDIDDVIPGSHCEITIKMGILKVNCPTIKFNEKWNFTSSKISPNNVPKVTNFGDIFDVYLHTVCDEDANEKLEVENTFNKNSDKEVTEDISNENFDKKVATWRDGVSKVFNAIELQESTTKFLNVLLNLSDTASIDPFDSEEINHDYAFYDSPFYDSNEEEVKQATTVSSSISEFDSSIIDSNKERNLFLDISGTQQQEQLKVSKEQDHSVFDNIQTSLRDSKDLEHFYALEKNLFSLLKNEMSNIITRYLPKSSYENNYRNNICNTLRYIRSTYQYPWDEQYVTLRELLKYGRNSDSPHSMDDSYYRKKRMAHDLTWQQDQVSNTLEEDDKDVDLLENLRKIFQKLEILALYIDRLHERYLLHNKLDDDYASSEFPIETKERELYTSRIV